MQFYKKKPIRKYAQVQLHKYVIDGKNLAFECNSKDCYNLYGIYSEQCNRKKIRIPQELTAHF